MNVVTASKEPVPTSVATPTLSMHGITKHFDGVAALTDVSFEVLPGDAIRRGAQFRGGFVEPAEVGKDFSDLPATQ